MYFSLKVSTFDILSSASFVSGVDICLLRKMDRKSQNLLKIWKKTKKSGNIKRVKATQVKQMLKVENVQPNLAIVNEWFHEVNVPLVELKSNSREEDEFSTDSEQAELFPENYGVIPDADHLVVQSVNKNSDISDRYFEFNKDKFQSELVCWAIHNEVNHVQLRRLLEIWNNFVPLPRLPADPRTLLKTPKMIEIFDDPDNKGQKYWYHGMKKPLETFLNGSANVPSIIHLNISCDGLPISGSSNECFWPILFNIYEMPKIKPFVAGIYHGYSEFSVEFNSYFHQNIFNSF